MATNSNKQGFDPLALLGQLAKKAGDVYNSGNTGGSIPTEISQFLLGKQGTGNGDVNSPTGGGESTLGALVRGNWGDIVPSFNRNTAYYAAHPENMQFSGDTANVSDQPVSSFTRDMRYKQGSDNPSAYKPKPGVDTTATVNAKAAADPYGYTPTGGPTETTYGPSEPTGWTAQSQDNLGNSTTKQGPGYQPNQSLPPITVKQPNVFTKAANVIKSDIGKVESPDIAKSSFGTQHTAEIQDALKRNNVYHLSQTGPASQRLYDQIINPELARNPKVVPLNGDGSIVDEIVSEMKKQSPGISDREARAAAAKVTTSLYNVARNQTGEVTPNGIDTASVLQMKTLLNNTTPVRNFFDHGVPPTTIEGEATLASRNALGKILEREHPNVAQATKDYGLIHDAVPGLYKATQQSTPAYNLPAIGINVGKNVASGTLRTVGKIADNPIGKAALITGGAAAIGGGSYMAGKGSMGENNPNNTQNNQGKNDLNSVETNNQPSSNLNSTPHNATIPQSIDDIKPDNQGKYSVVDPYQLKDPTGSPKFVGDKEYANQVTQNNALIDQKTTQLADPQVRFNPIKSAQIQAEIENLKTANSSLDQKHQASAQVNAAYSAVKNLNNQYDAAEKTLKDTEPNLLTGLPYIGSQAAQWREATDSKYSTMVQKIKQLEINAGLPPGSLYKPGQTKEVLQANLETARKNSLNTFYTGLNTVLGGNQTSSPSPTNTMPPITTQAPSYPTTPSTSNLPPIVSGLKLNPLDQQIATP